MQLTNPFAGLNDIVSSWDAERLRRKQLKLDAEREQRLKKMQAENLSIMHNQDRRAEEES